MSSKISTDRPPGDGRDVLKTALTEAGNKDEDSRTTITDDKQVETSTMTESDTNNRSAAAAGDEAAERSASPAAERSASPAAERSASPAAERSASPAADEVSASTSARAEEQSPPSQEGSSNREKSVGKSGKKTSVTTRTSSSSNSSSSQQDPQLVNKTREEKRQKMKDYLRELQTLVPLDKDQKPGTLGLLKEVLGRMKMLSKVKKEQNIQSMEGSGLSRKSLPMIKVGCNSQARQQYVAPPISSKSSSTDVSLGDFYVVLTINTGRIVDIGSKLLELLRFHKDNLLNEEFLAFIHQSDLGTFKTIMSAFHAMLHTPTTHSSDESKSDETFSSDESANMFFFRLRQYKSLKRGSFSLRKPKKFLIFRGMVNVRKSRSVDNASSSPQHIVLDCTPVTSAYHSPKVAPAKRFFSTRHTMMCVYNFVDAAAVELLGYLPHDMVGTSIFDYYHPDDLPLLLNAYEEVLKRKTVKTSPYRLRVKNGSYILVATEWSSFFGVWSHKLELIICRHEVLQGPEDISIFSEPSFKTQSATKLSLHEITNYQCQIESLLLNSLRMPGENFSSRENSRNEGSKVVAHTEVEKNAEIKKTDGTKQDVTEKREGKVKIKSYKAMENVLMKDKQQRDIMYGQLNYAHNIKRYLMSQTMISSDESEKRSSSTDEMDSSMLSDDLVDVEIPCMPKAPSFASSTKALVSEHDDAPHSPVVAPPVDELSSVIIKESVHETGHSSSSISCTLTPTTGPVTRLTKQTLSIHTKLMEEKYIMDVTHDQNSMFSNNGQSRHSLKGVSKSPSSDQSKGLLQSRSRKRAKQHLSNRNVHLDPPFPFGDSNPFCQYNGSQKFKNSRLESSKRKRSNADGKTAADGLGKATITSAKDHPGFLEGQPMGFPGGTNRSSGSQDTGMHWPFYPQADGKFMPQVMSGFWEPFGQSWPSSAESGPPGKVKEAASGDSDCKPCHMIMTHGASDGESKNNGSGGSFVGVDSSSISYLLDLDDVSLQSLTNASSSNPEENVFKRPHQCQISSGPWLTHVRNKSDVLMKYTVPKRKLSQVLQSDKKRLRRMVQEPIVGVQLSMLLTDMGCSSPPQDEEADILFSIDQKAVSFTEPEKVEEGSRKMSSLRHKLAKKRLRENSSLSLSSKKQVDRLFTEPLMLPPSCSPKSDEMLSGKMSPPKSSGSPSQLDKTSDVSYTSTELTPSDQRSNDEASSSLKESDLSSCDGAKSSKYTSSESEMENNYTQQLPDQLFTNLNVTFSQPSQHLPHWLALVNYSPHVQYHYKIKSGSLEEILEQDRKKLDQITQPEMISFQMLELLTEMNLTNDQTAENATSQSVSGTSQSLFSDSGNKFSTNSSGSDDKRSADSDPNCLDQKSLNSRSDLSNNENELLESRSDEKGFDFDAEPCKFPENDIKEGRARKQDAHIKTEALHNRADKPGTESGETSTGSHNDNVAKMFGRDFMMRGMEAESVCTHSSSVSFSSKINFIRKVFMKEEDEIDIDNLIFSLD